MGGGVGVGRPALFISFPCFQQWNKFVKVTYKLLYLYAASLKIVSGLRSELKIPVANGSFLLKK